MSSADPGELATEVAVVGGGIIGLCIAESLADAGLEVTLVEKNRIAAGASAGNAAGFAFSEVMPMASPATVRKAAGWFLDPTGPFAVVRGDLHRTAGWLLRFLFAARRATFERSLQSLGALMQLEQQCLPLLLERAGLQDMVRETGALYLYQSRRALERETADWERRRAHGTEFELLDRSSLHALQEGLSEQLVAAVHAPRFRMVTDPGAYCEALHARLSTLGVETVYAPVERLAADASGVILQGAEGRLGRAERVIVAAGPWSARLAAGLGDRLPLIGERGYNTTFPRDAFASLDRLMFFAEHGFVMSPVASGIRVGGASEIADLERAPNFERARAMVRRARDLVPGLAECEGVEWMGMRPTTPDTVPIIGRARDSGRVVYACGHGHLGLTLASSTARLVTDLVLGRPTVIELAALAPGRF